MIKTYILDTNVLLSDPNALNSFGDDNVVLPFIVIEELDKHKSRQDEVGKNAREIARKISLLVKENKDLVGGISLGDKRGTLRVLSLIQASNGQVCDIPAEIEESKTGDNTIVKFCLGFIKAHPEENVTLVSRDVLLQLKAMSLQINVENYSKINTASDAEALYSGCTEINTVDVTDFYRDPEGFRLPEEISNHLPPNECLLLKSQSINGFSSALVRFISKDKPLRKVSDKTLGKYKTRNKEQEFALDLLMDQNVKLVTLVGFSGTGKTLTAIAAGLEQVIGQGIGSVKNPYKSLVVCRPIQPVGKDLGYLPGTLEEKLEPWIAPIKDNLRFLVTEGKRGKQAEDILKSYFEEGIIEVEAMAFIRGRSITDAFIIVDEAQNLSIHELKTILTRAGEGTKIVLTGDIGQVDCQNLDAVSNGLSIAVETFRNQPISGHITLTKGERSELATIAAKLLG
jgi:PhoH-like ATPase